MFHGLKVWMCCWRSRTSQTTDSLKVNIQCGWHLFPAQCTSTFNDLRCTLTPLPTPILVVFGNCMPQGLSESGCHTVAHIASAKKDMLSMFPFITSCALFLGKYVKCSAFGMAPSSRQGRLGCQNGQLYLSGQVCQMVHVSSLVRARWPC